MNFFSWVVIAAVALAFAAAVRYIVKNRNKLSCGGDCESCGRCGECIYRESGGK